MAASAILGCRYLLRCFEREKKNSRNLGWHTGFSTCSIHTICMANFLQALPWHGPVLCAGWAELPMCADLQYLLILLGFGLLSRVFEIPVFDQEKAVQYVEEAGNSCRQRSDFAFARISSIRLLMALICNAGLLLSLIVGGACF